MTAPAEPAPVRVAVGAGEAGRRLDAVVGALEQVGSRAEAQRLIEAGRVLVDGRTVAKRHLLAVGERLEVRPAPAAAGGHRARGHAAHGAVRGRAPAGRRQARGGRRAPQRRPPERDAGARAAGARHRRRRGSRAAGDRPPPRPRHLGPPGRRAHRRAPTGACSGCCAIALVDRRYLALVHGAAPPALTIDRPVGRDRRVRTRMAVGAADGREAVTHLRRLEELGRFSLLEARLETGRTHQIRVHLESVGHPVVGDRVYGRRARDARARAPVPPRRPAGVPAPRDRGAAWRSRARCPTTCGAPWPLARRGAPAGAKIVGRSTSVSHRPGATPARWRCPGPSSATTRAPGPSARAGARPPKPQHRSRPWQPSP